MKSPDRDKNGPATETQTAQEVTMKKVIATLAMIAATPAAMAADCEEMRLSSSYLTELFCAELGEIAGPDGATRSITDGSEEAPLADWPDFTLLQDAYRADPKKTLELIARIKKAGGLGAQ